MAEPGAITLAVLSDVHLEIRRIQISRMGMSESGVEEALAAMGKHAALRAADADLVIIAGDLASGGDGIAWAETAFAPKPVVYVAGNHEFYRHEIDPLLRELHRLASRTRNVRFLENEQVSFALQGQALRVLGCTLWTDYQLYGRARRAEMMHAAAHGLLDHRRIRSPSGKFYRPDEALARHETSRTWLGAKLALPFAGITVVATHHAPLAVAIAPRFASDVLSPAFASDCADLLHYAPAAWVFGHTHYNFDRQLGATRLFSYQWGYPGEGLEADVGLLAIPIPGADT
jgi:predicted phosphodiesterase